MTIVTSRQPPHPSGNGFFVALMNYVNGENRFPVRGHLVTLVTLSALFWYHNIGHTVHPCVGHLVASSHCSWRDVYEAFRSFAVCTHQQLALRIFANQTTCRLWFLRADKHSNFTSTTMFERLFSIVSYQILNCESARRCFHQGENPSRGLLRALWNSWHLPIVSGEMSTSDVCDDDGWLSSAPIRVGTLLGSASWEILATQTGGTSKI